MLVAEELILMSISPENGSEIFFNAWKNVKAGIAGALIMDLALLRRIFCRNGKIILLSTKSTGDHLLNEILANIQRSDSAKSIDFWVSEIHSNIRNLQDRLIERMVNQGIIEREIHPAKFGMKTYYPIVKKEIYRDILNRIQSLEYANEIQDFHTYTLVYILQSCGLNKLFRSHHMNLPTVRISSSKIFSLIEQEKRTTKQYVKELLCNISTYISREHVISIAV
ncbi:MAG: GPP34 family phosphoprotein [Candidatus Lokiarchaeota archaeon]|nr:GPP34 family phosphoprotein [Candidatus Harpocratesius repetitus]